MSMFGFGLFGNEENAYLTVNGKGYNINIKTKNGMYFATIKELPGHSLSSLTIEGLWKLIKSTIDKHG